MNNQSQTSFTQHPSTDPTEGTGITGPEPPNGLQNPFHPRTVSTVPACPGGSSGGLTQWPCTGSSVRAPTVELVPLCPRSGPAHVNKATSLQPPVRPQLHCGIELRTLRVFKALIISSCLRTVHARHDGRSVVVMSSVARQTD